MNNYLNNSILTVCKTSSQLIVGLKKIKGMRAFLFNKRERKLSNILHVLY